MQKKQIITPYDPYALGELLRSARRAKGLSLPQLGEKIGVSAKTLARIETAQTPVTVDALFAFCVVCNADANELLAGASGKRTHWPSAARAEMEFARQFVMARYGIENS